MGRSTPDDSIIRTNIPVFAPSKIVSVTATELYTPADEDKAFFVSDDTTMTIGAATVGSLYVNLAAGQIIGIKSGMTFTFTTTTTLAVM